MPAQKLSNLDPRSYEHHFDRRALDALEGTPGLEALVAKFNQYGIERLLKIQFTGSYLKITPDSFPEVHDALRQVCEILYLPGVPELYVMPAGGVNAFTTGVEKPVIVLNSGALELLSPEELAFVIGHEVGHIKSRHTLYLQMGTALPVLGEIIGAVTLNIGALFSKGLEIALLNWARMAEFTADRAGLLACQNMDAAISVMMKLAGLPFKYYDNINTQDFITQAREFTGYDIDRLDRIAKVVSTIDNTHPWTVMRGAEMLKWIDTGEYDRLLSRPVDDAPKLACSRCSTSLTGNERFCPRCGARLGPSA